MGKKLEQAIAILNGAVGDHLARTDNGLATAMAWVSRGHEAAASPAKRVVVLVHGLMCTEDIWAHEDGEDYGSLLARDLGFSPRYVRYNTGLSIPDNGASLSRLLAELVRDEPGIEEIVPLGYSMGGLVIRAACHEVAMKNEAAGAPQAGDWLSKVKKVIYVGTPHLGAPLERVGRVLSKVLAAIPDPYTRLAAELVDLRSDGVKDLGDADLRHEDRARRVARLSLRDPRHPVPLLPSLQHYLVAGTLWGDVRLAGLLGDAVVPVPSSTNGACIDAGTLALPPSHVRLLEGVSHVVLPHDPRVYEHVKEWCAS
ncbi:MAG: alpha/beta hydrolase [Deltaproteobacteria bacterium]|nr:alpha/beta hydrolase [Deltaproteobacteria bacterium]